MTTKEKGAQTAKPAEDVQTAKPAEDVQTAKPAEDVQAVKPVEEDVASKFVPVFLDENGEQIPRNSILRVATTEKVNGNLRAIDGTLITPQPTTELHGPDIRDGDWFTTQYRAGFIRVDTVKKIR